VLATSSVPLYELVADGRFPADLYYRLNVVTLTDDITLLASTSAAIDSAGRAPQWGRP
jgi:DNA-binding NtrC family response regulator